MILFYCTEWLLGWLQGNCHACTVPKRQMDDMDSYFLPRTKEGMIKAVSDAMLKGKYPGWKKEALSNNAALKHPLPASEVKPVPLRNDKTGAMPLGRRILASSKIGRNLLFNFWDDLEGIDLHKQVQCMQTKLKIMIVEPIFALSIQNQNSIYVDFSFCRLVLMSCTQWISEFGFT